MYYRVKPLHVVIWVATSLMVCLVVNVDLSTILKFMFIGIIVGYVWEGPFQRLIDRMNRWADKKEKELNS